MDFKEIISSHDFFCLMFALSVCFVAVGFVVVIGYFWDSAYRKGYEDAIKDM